MEPIVLNPEVMSLLLKLASEEGKTPEDIISEMIEKRDSDRHVV